MNKQDPRLLVFTIVAVVTGYGGLSASAGRAAPRDHVCRVDTRGHG